ncbi:MAG: hypothetical protein ACRD22_06925 [Terriglobia bacterium]
MNFKADLVYGGSHTRKTTNLGLAAEYYYRILGVNSRIWSCDGGGLEPLELLIADNIIAVQVVSPDDRAMIETLTLAAQGYWPNESGKMVPPSPDQKLGIVGFEGLYSIGESILSRLRRKGTKLQQGPSFDYQDGNTVFHGGNMTYVGFAQDLLKDWIRTSHQIDSAQRVIWTSLEDTADNEVTKRREGGPAAPGNKMVTRTAQMFCNTIRLSKDGDKFVAHLARHADRMGTEFPAGVRLPYQLAAKVPAEMPPDIGKFYEFLDRLRAESIGAAKNNV